MKAVGVRDLKNRLSEYLRRVRSGENLLVTDRGEVVAELSPPGQLKADPTIPAGLQALAKRGLITLGTPVGGPPSDVNLYPALPRGHRERRHSAVELLDEERGAR